jgi:hypothetical protein
VPCGGGASSRTFHVTSPAVGGGDCCPVEDLETECVPCNAVACPYSSSAPVVDGVSSSAPVVGGGDSSTADSGHHCGYDWHCSEEGSDNLHGVPQCCYEYKCGHNTGSGSEPQCGWRASCLGDVSENSVNVHCEWNWYCPPSLNNPPSCAWRWLCSESGQCNFDFYCGHADSDASTGVETPHEDEESSTAPAQVGGGDNNTDSTSSSGGDVGDHGGDDYSSLNGVGHTAMTVITPLAVLCVSIVLAF